MNSPSFLDGWEYYWLLVSWRLIWGLRVFILFFSPLSRLPLDVVSSYISLVCLGLFMEMRLPLDLLWLSCLCLQCGLTDMHFHILDQHSSEYTETLKIPRGVQWCEVSRLAKLKKYAGGNMRNKSGFDFLYLHFFPVKPLTLECIDYLMVRGLQRPQVLIRLTPFRFLILKSIVSNHMF